ncbi:MAG TPA: TIGR02266 family protein [Sandaracinaceae bacterium LLY-WYZ-13_1]|nr:TIGR02266 family protein [Sandaracinaceae bacterium LLY-WYZ-13_1]
MEATAAVALDDGEEMREARRAGELIDTAIDVLREEVPEDGPMARAVERLARVAPALSLDHVSGTFETAVTANHRALADTLAIGRAVREVLEPRARQCLETLASAQQLLYPIARARGLEAQPVPAEASEPPSPSADMERRASPRVDLEVEVGFESETNFYQGFSEDLSDGGLFVATYQLSPVGTVFEIEFTLPTGHIVRAEAEVRWLRDLRDGSTGVSPGMGLQFKGLLPEDERAIAQFVQARSPIFYDAD